MADSKKRIMSYVLLVAIILIALSIYLFNKFSAVKGDFVEVSINGEVEKTFSLSEDCEFTIKGEGGENKLIIKNHSCYIESADCPDKLCVTQGVISRSGESIICLPHKVVVTIKGEYSDEIDSIAK